MLVGLPSRSMTIRDLLMVPLPPSPLGLRPHVSRDDCITPQLRQHPLPLGEHSALLHELPRAPPNGPSFVPGAEMPLRTVDVSAKVPNATDLAFNSTFSFAMPDAAAVAIRVLADRAIVELFVASGRGVVSTPVLQPGKDPAKASAYLLAGDGTGLTLSAASAWEMGCCWASYP